MRVTKEYLKQVIKESIEEAIQEEEQNNEAVQNEAEDKGPSSYAATIDKKYTAHFYRDGKVAFEGPDGKVDATTVTRLKNTNKFRDAKERAKKAGYGG